MRASGVPTCLTCSGCARRQDWGGLIRAFDWLPSMPDPLFRIVWPIPAAPGDSCRCPTSGGGSAMPYQGAVRDPGRDESSKGAVSRPVTDAGPCWLRSAIPRGVQGVGVRAMPGLIPTTHDKLPHRRASRNRMESVVRHATPMLVAVPRQRSHHRRDGRHLSRVRCEAHRHRPSCTSRTAGHSCRRTPATNSRGDVQFLSRHLDGERAGGAEAGSRC